MTTTFPNPQKKNIVASPLKSVREALIFIRYIDYRYVLVNSEEALNQYHFESGKFLRDGALIEIILSENSVSGTEMTIEVRRKPGAFEKDRQVTLANKYIPDIETLLSKILKLTPEQKEKYEGAPASSQPEKDKKEYTCGICKKLFYADRKKNPIAICPHCKSRNSLIVQKEPSGWGTFINLVFLVSNIFSKDRK